MLKITFTELEEILSLMARMDEKITRLEQLTQAERDQGLIVGKQLDLLRGEVAALNIQITELREQLATGEVVTEEQLARLDELGRVIEEIVTPEQAGDTGATGGETPAPVDAPVAPIDEVAPVAPVDAPPIEDVDEVAPPVDGLGGDLV